MEVLARVVENGGQLLRVERDPAGLLLTFDLGRVRVSAAAGGLEAALLDAGDSPPEGAADAGEEEPWWRFLGNPLTAVWPGDPDPASVRLRFRPEGENPRVVRLVAEGRGVRASLEA